MFWPYKAIFRQLRMNALNHILLKFIFALQCNVLLLQLMLLCMETTWSKERVFILKETHFSAKDGIQ
jgi:hypothetical protein